MMNLEDLFEDLGLSTYQAKALIALIRCGEAKASEIAQMSGIPRAKVYLVLDQLVDMGLADKKPGRPTKFIAKKPEEVVERLKFNIESEYREKIKMFNEFRDEIVEALKSIYRPKSEPIELIRVVRVGEPSERETKIIFTQAKREIDIISKVFEYYPKVRDELISADRRGVKIKVLLLGKDMLDEKGKVVQDKIVDMLKNDLKNVEIRFSKTTLPLRGVIVDPSYDYSSGKAIFVVEDPRTPLYLRDAAVTENPSLVAGMKKYFDLIWKYESEKN